MNTHRTIFTSLVVILLNSFPTVAWAENKQISSTLNAHNGSYQALIEQAESWAGKLIEQAFTQNSSLTEVAVSIIGERNGQYVPLLTAKVSRANWQESPQTRSWAQYFSDSAVLLGFKQVLQPQTNAIRLQNQDFLNKDVASSHLEPNFYE
jgi:hypothetical protein